MYQKTSNSVHALFYHVILTVKYRKPLISVYEADIKKIISDMSKNWSVEKIEGERDHIHLLIATTPNISPAHLIKEIKQKTTYELWQKYAIALDKQFFKRHTFWSRSYFVYSIGSVSKEAIERYILNQKRNSSVKLKHNRLFA